jgi:hypothetical protein
LGSSLTHCQRGDSPGSRCRSPWDGAPRPAAAAAASLRQNQPLRSLVVPPLSLAPRVGSGTGSPLRCPVSRMGEETGRPLFTASCMGAEVCCIISPDRFRAVGVKTIRISVLNAGPGSRAGREDAPARFLSEFSVATRRSPYSLQTRTSFSLHIRISANFIEA